MEHEAIDERSIRVALSGRLDSTAVGSIEPEFRQLLDEAGKHVMVDLGEVAFAASMAIRMFVATARLMQRRGRLMVLYGAQPLVREVFLHVALDDLIPVLGNRAEAQRWIADTSGAA